MTSPIRAVIFDFDGLIVDTESTGYRTWTEIYAEHGHDLPLERYAQVIGSDFNDRYDPRKDLELLTGIRFDWETLEKKRKDRERELRRELLIHPGVLDRLREAKELGLATAIGSSSPRFWIDSWVDQLGLHGQFDHISTVDDTGRVKPDPSIYIHAADNLGAAADEVLIFEDSLNGLNAARAAGMRCIVVPGPMTRHLDFPGALRRVDSLEDVSLKEFV